MQVVQNILWESWQVMRVSAPYLLLGFGMAGILYIFLSPAVVQRYLGKGGTRSVFMASILGAPIPLCSCGVLPAAVSLKRQGASKGATAAFLVATPETGLDSIAITYALFDPLMTILRPLSAIITACVAGIGVNYFGEERKDATQKGPVPDVCRVDGCCDGIDCPPQVHRSHHSFLQKMAAAVKYASVELMNDVAGWFLLGVLIAGLISYLVPADLISQYLGTGLLPMLVMLVVGTPLYVCATASTPIAVALVLKGLSPGAALVFLLAGPATNATALSVIGGILGRRTMFIYLGAIMICSVLMGLVVDAIYSGFGIQLHLSAVQASEWMPPLVETILGLLLFLYMSGIVVRKWVLKRKGQVTTCACPEASHEHQDHQVVAAVSSSCGPDCHHS